MHPLLVTQWTRILLDRLPGIFERGQQAPDESEKTIAQLHQKMALHTRESTIGVMHHTEALVRSELATAQTANNQFQAAKSARLAATAAQATADTNAMKFITAARDVLKVHLGGRYSQAWDEAGFNSQSLAVPATILQRTELLESLELYLAAHAAYEVAAFNVTQS